MRPQYIRDNESPAELHRIALNAHTYTAGQVAGHRGTSPETLHYLIHKEIFPIPVMAQRNHETEAPLSENGKRDLWRSAVSNPVLTTEDLIWIYEQVSGSTYAPQSGIIPSLDFSYTEIQILKGIGVHRNTPSELVEIIKAIRVNGNSVLLKYDFDARDEREYENYFIDWRGGKPVAPTPPPKPKTIPGALPGADRFKYFPDL